MGIPRIVIINICLYEHEILEITTKRAYVAKLVEKLSKNLKFLPGFHPEEIIDKSKIPLESLIHFDKNIFINKQKLNIEILYELKIKIKYVNFLITILKRTKEISSDEYLDIYNPLNQDLIVEKNLNLLINDNKDNSMNTDNNKSKTNTMPNQIEEHLETEETDKPLVDDCIITEENIDTL